MNLLEAIAKRKEQRTPEIKDKERRKRLVREQTEMILAVTAYRNRLTGVNDGLLVQGGTVRKETTGRVSGKEQVEQNRMRESITDTPKDVGLEDSEIGDYKK